MNNGGNIAYIMWPPAQHIDWSKKYPKKLCTIYKCVLQSILIECQQFECLSFDIWWYLRRNKTFTMLLRIFSRTQHWFIIYLYKWIYIGIYNEYISSSNLLLYYMCSCTQVFIASIFVRFRHNFFLVLFKLSHWLILHLLQSNGKPIFDSCSWFLHVARYTLAQIWMVHYNFFLCRWILFSCECNSFFLSCRFICVPFILSRGCWFSLQSQIGKSNGFSKTKIKKKKWNVGSFIFDLVHIHNFMHLLRLPFFICFSQCFFNISVDSGAYCESTKKYCEFQKMN